MSTSAQERHKTVAVNVGGVIVGGGAPIVVQSMTNTDTADVEATARQVAALARAGSELVRITVDRDEAAEAVPQIKDRLAQLGVAVPIVGDFHYNGHTLLTDYPGCAEALDKYRINPGNVGFKNKRDPQFTQIVEMAIKYDKPVRIGVNWGSLDQELLTRLMDENAKSDKPRDAREVTHEAMVQSALLSAARAEEIGLAKNRIILSAKVSAVQDLIAVYTRTRAPLRLRAASRPHRGRHGLEGHRCLLRCNGRAAATGHRRHDPRVAHAGAERRPHARGAGGAGTAADHGPAHLRAAGRRLSRLRPHHVDHVPGARVRHPGFHPQFDAGVEDALSGRRDAHRRGDGLHRQRPGRDRSTPTSAFRCPAPASSRPRRCSSTARRWRPCAGRRSPPTSSRW